MENQYFADLAAVVRTSGYGSNEDSAVLGALHLTHRLLADRAGIFASHRLPVTSSYGGSLTEDLLTAQGACGSYSNVLCELLRQMGYTARIGQMKVKGLYGGHIITECHTTRGWIALDGMYDQYFITPAHRFASCKEVGGNWDYYRHQTNGGYDMDYCYTDVQYTNWGKLPVVMPVLKKLIVLIRGRERADSICLRTLVLRKYRVYYRFVAIILSIIISLYIVRHAPAFFGRLPAGIFGLTRPGPAIRGADLMRP